MDDALSEAEAHLDEAKDLLDQLKQPLDEETEAERALDRTSIEEGYGQVLATQQDHHAALQRFLAAYTLLLPYARQPGCSIGITICVGRVGFDFSSLESAFSPFASAFGAARIMDLACWPV